MKGGLTRRMVVASGLLALIVAAAFAVLLLSIADLRESADRARHSEEVLAAANRLERLVIDTETGLRGYIITGDERFLQPWEAARAAFPEQAQTLGQLVADNPEQLRSAQRIAMTGMSYIEDYSVPLVDATRRGEAFPQSTASTLEGKRLVDAMRVEFDDLVATERGLSAAREDRSDAAARRAIVAGVGGLAGSVVLILIFSGYLTRQIVLPVRRASVMAGRLADGDLGTRMPESSIGEIGALEPSFNTMASSLERSRAELAASRRRIVAASDQTRRWIERDLHDGTQQRLVSLGLELRAAELTVPPELAEVKVQMSRVAEGLDGALEDLREIRRSSRRLGGLALEERVEAGLILRDEPRLQDLPTTDVEDLHGPALERPAVRASPRHVEHRDDVVLARGDVVDLERGDGDLNALREGREDLLSPVVLARERAPPGRVPHDVLVEVFVQPLHVARDERVVPRTDELDVFLVDHGCLRLPVEDRA